MKRGHQSITPPSEGHQLSHETPARLLSQIQGMLSVPVTDAELDKTVRLLLGELDQCQSDSVPVGPTLQRLKDTLRQRMPLLDPISLLAIVEAVVKHQNRAR